MMNWAFWKDRHVRQERTTMHAVGSLEYHEARAEAALDKAIADTPRVEELAADIRHRIEENQWSPKIAAAFRVPPRR